jgi:hypothetical protein
VGLVRRRVKRTKVGVLTLVCLNVLVESGKLSLKYPLKLEISTAQDLDFAGSNKIE